MQYFAPGSKLNYFESVAVALLIYFSLLFSTVTPARSVESMGPKDKGDGSEEKIPPDQKVVVPAGHGDALSKKAVDPAGHGEAIKKAVDPAGHGEATKKAVDPSGHGDTLTKKAVDTAGHGATLTKKAVDQAGHGDTLTRKEETETTPSACRTSRGEPLSTASKRRFSAVKVKIEKQSEFQCCGADPFLTGSEYR